MKGSPSAKGNRHVASSNGTKFSDSDSTFYGSGQETSMTEQLQSDTAQLRRTQRSAGSSNGHFQASDSGQCLSGNGFTLSCVQNGLYEFVDEPVSNATVKASAKQSKSQSKPSQSADGDDSVKRTSRKRGVANDSGSRRKNPTTFGSDRSQNVPANKLCRTVVELPLARIKTIMKTSPDVETVGMLPLIAVTKSTELFIAKLVRLSYANANAKVKPEESAAEAGKTVSAQENIGNNEINYNSLAHLVACRDELDFLTEVIPKKMRASDWLSKFKQLYEDE